MSSKFSNLLSQARNRTSEDDELVPEGNSPKESVSVVATSAKSEAPAQETPEQEDSSPVVRRTKSKTTGQPKQPPALPEQTEPIARQGATRGRPRTGKRSDPNFTQITAYISKETHRAIKLALLQEAQDHQEKEREISELIEECLLAWLKNPT